MYTFTSDQEMKQKTNGQSTDTNFEKLYIIYSLVCSFICQQYKMKKWGYFEKTFSELHVKSSFC